MTPQPYTKNVAVTRTCKTQATLMQLTSVPIIVCGRSCQKIRQVIPSLNIKQNKAALTIFSSSYTLTITIGRILAETFHIYGSVWNCK